MKLTPKYLDGAFLAVNALRGGYAVIDAPRCELERAWIFDATHDWYARIAGTGPYARDRRIFAPLWKNYTVVTGTEEVFRDLVHYVSARHPDSPILLYPSFLSILVNADLEGLATSLAAEVPNPLLCVERQSIEDDWIDGIRQTQATIFRFISGADGSSRPTMAGFCPFRLEGDEMGNVIEIERLWRKAGLPDTVWPFNGRPFSFEQVSERAPLIAFPVGFDRDLTPWSGDVIPVDLPIGLQNTCRFLRTVGQYFGRIDEVERIIERECRQLEPRLAPMVSNVLAGRSVVVVADPWNGQGLAAAMHELGVDVCLAVILRRQDAGEHDLQAVQIQATELWIDPKYQEVEERIAEIASKGLCDAVVGSGVLRDAAERASLPYVEVTAPHFLEHFAAPNPYMGFEGLARLAERLGNAIMQRNHQRRFSCTPVRF